MSTFFGLVDLCYVLHAFVGFHRLTMYNLLLSIQKPFPLPKTNLHLKNVLHKRPFYMGPLFRK